VTAAPPRHPWFWIVSFFTLLAGGTWFVVYPIANGIINGGSHG
jgi:hypothetical protein